MKRSVLILIGIIAAAGLIATTGQAQSTARTEVSRPMTVRPSSPQHSTMAASANRSTVRNYSRGGTRYYYNGGRGYRGYYYGGPSVSVGVGGVYDYPGYYGYGYDYPYAYGYPYGHAYDYPSNYYYDEYPSGYVGTTTYTTTTSGDMAYDDNVVVAVQERLKRAGYYLGEIDGIAGPETRSAIARWEGNHGMYADGRIDQATLRSLGLG